MLLPCKKSQKAPKSKFHQLWHFGSPDQNVKEPEAQRGEQWLSQEDELLFLLIFQDHASLSSRSGFTFHLFRGHTSDSATSFSCHPSS
jgi:hypothetical protein